MDSDVGLYLPLHTYPICRSAVVPLAATVTSPEASKVSPDSSFYLLIYTNAT
jgi:hypothetical protein